MEAGDDPYNILGVAKDATPADIKKAYRTLALKNHPDKQSNEADREKASGIFAKIAEAYEILSDEEERKQHDLRQKYGGAPGTRYTTYDDDQTTVPPTRSTTTRTSTSPKKTTRVRQAQPSSSPDSGTFRFSYDPTKTRSGNPYEIFQEVFGSDFQAAFPGAVLSPSKSPRCKSVPVSPATSAVRAPSSRSPRKNTGRQTMPKSPLSSNKPMMQNIPNISDVCHDDGIVSMSTSTKTICHDDGSQEVVTEMTITRSDGSTKISRESSRSSAPMTRMSSQTRPSGNKTIKTIQPTGRTIVSTRK